MNEVILQADTTLPFLVFYASLVRFAIELKPDKGAFEKAGERTLLNDAAAEMLHDIYQSLVQHELLGTG